MAGPWYQNQRGRYHLVYLEPIALVVKRKQGLIVLKKENKLDFQVY